MCKVPKYDWETGSHRQGIIDEIQNAVSPGQGHGLGESFYDVKSTFQEDAMACFKSFHRPTDPSYCDFQ